MSLITMLNAQRAINSGQQNAFQIRTSGRDVIANGTVITYDNKNLEFTILGMKLILNFRNDKDRLKMESATTGQSEITLTLHNFNSKTGVGTSRPIEVGKLNEKNLLFAFMVYSQTEDGCKTVDYTFMVEEPA